MDQITETATIPVRTLASGADLIAALGHAPYAVIGKIGSDKGYTRGILHSLLPVPDGETPKISFTRIRVAAYDAHEGGLVTRMSRTNAAIPPHTDCSYAPAPHNLVAFEMLEADETGGTSILVDGETIVRELDEPTIRLLSMPIFPFGKHRYPILKIGLSGVQIRYYRAQVDKGLEQGHPLPEPALVALRTLDELLDRPDLQHRVRVPSGHVLFFANRRVLHGRTGFGPDSRRLMHRYRVTVPGLGLE